MEQFEGQNRRQHERLETDHPAELMLEGRPFALGRIRNYSNGGLYLRLSTDDIERIRPHANNSEQHHSVSADIHIQNQDDSSATPLKVPAHIAFASEHGVGVAFMQASKEVIDYLAKYERPATDDQDIIATIPSSNRGGNAQTLAAIGQLLSDFIRTVHPHIHQAIMDSLAENVDQATQHEQTELLHARTILERNKDRLLEQFLAIVMAGWNQLGESQQDDENAQVEGMELVNQDEFDQWTTVIKISRRIESQLSNKLHDITQCLAYLVKRPINSENSPLAPYNLLWSCKRALDSVNIGNNAKEVIYNACGDMLLIKIGPLIKQAYAILEEDGIAAKAKITSTKKAAPPPEKKSIAQPRRKPRTLISTLASTLGGGATVEDPANVSSNAATSLAMEHMIQGDVRDLADWVERQLSTDEATGEKLVLSQESRQIINVTGQLLSAAQQDPRHSRTMRQLLQQIQLPLAKAAIKNPSILNDKEQPTRQLLDDIDQLALLSPAEHDGPLQSVIDTLSAAGGNADLQQITDQISELLEQRKDKFSHNAEQVVAGCEADRNERRSVLNIREFLLQELGESIAAPIDQMLRLGWASLLVAVANEGESKTKRLQNYKRTLSLLAKAFQPKRSSVNLPEDKLSHIVKLLRLGFRNYPLFKEESEILIEQLEEALTKNDSLFQQLNVERIAVTTEYIKQLLPLVNETPEGASISVYPKWQKQIANIKIGDWITDHHQHGRVRLLSLVWRSKDNSRLVFVNGNGVKALDCSSNELATGLQQGRFDLVEDGGLPMVERAVTHALKENFEKLRQQSDMDELTGLYNRRAYQRELQRLIKESELEQSHHILICMDIDKFALVNDICGHDGGDQMLASIANICRSYLTRPGMLARTGDNEFSVLIEHCTADEGYRIAENQRQAIENYRFSWGGKEISVTASVGMTEITPDNILQPDKITQAALSACAQAKKDGQNCCRRYQPDKEEFKQRRRLAKSIPLIEKALAENSLELHAQLISPVFIGDGLTEHHEILLRRLDEKGKPASPVEFIQAAEQYGRMVSVDKWVVQNFMRWATEAAKKHGAENMGVFSINLSGQSIMDENFGQFLLEQIEHSPIKPQQLAFEITETVVVDQTSRVKKIIDDVRGMGCKLFLDDFGSGFASYSYLKDFPVDVVKIDGIFVKDVHQDDTCRAMVKSITEVAHNMDKLVVAEFVESEAILTVLRELEVDFAQGFGIGHPSPLQTLVL